MNPVFHEIPEGVEATLQPRAGSQRLERFGGRVLKQETATNAFVYVVSAEDGEWVVKDFSRKNFLVRYLVGWFLFRREWITLRKLQGLDGIPSEPIRLGPMTLAYRFVAGETLSSARNRKASLDPEYFLALEHLVAQLHARGFAHLDLRNGKNILLTPDGRPHLLDFQSGLWIQLLPKPFRRLFERIDYSGVYKWWTRLAPETVDVERRVVLQSVNRRRRRFWPFKPSRVRRRPEVAAMPTALEAR